MINSSTGVDQVVELGDYVEPDDANIDLAIAELRSLAQSRSVPLRFGGGTYNNLAPFTLAAGEHIEGMGREKTMLRFAGVGANDAAISLTGAGCRISDLAVNGGQSSFNGTGIRAVGCSRFTLDRVAISQFSLGAEPTRGALSITFSWIAMIRDCYISVGDQPSDNRAVYLGDQANAIHVEGGEIFGSHHGVMMVGGLNVTLSRVTVEGNGGTGVLCISTGNLKHGLKVRDCYFELNEEGDIKADDNLLMPEITGSYFAVDAASTTSPIRVGISGSVNGGLIHGNEFNGTTALVPLIDIGANASGVAIGPNVNQTTGTLVNDGGTGTGYWPSTSTSTVPASGTFTGDTVLTTFTVTHNLGLTAPFIPSSILLLHPDGSLMGAGDVTTNNLTTNAFDVVFSAPPSGAETYSWKVSA